MGTTVFELKAVHFSYLGKYPALCGVDLAIAQGEKIVFLGANGSGKSTLLHMLDGLIFPDRGAITAFGEDLCEERFNDRAFSLDFRRKVGLVFQNSDIQLFCPTVKEDILFAPLQLGLSRRETEARFEELTAILGIKGLLERAPHQLSIGEKRKVAIASTLIIDPEVLLLDEPTAGLDPKTSCALIDTLVDDKKLARTVVISTHDLHIVPEIAERVIVLGEDKRVVREAAPDELLHDRPFLEAHNLVHAHAHRHKGVVHVHPHEHLEHQHGKG